MASRTVFTVMLIAASISLAACNPAAAPPSFNSANSVTSPAPNPTSTVFDDTVTTKVYSLDEIAKHTTPTDCWMAIHGKVYNVSNFGDEGHPGKQAIYQGCGKDATDLFETRPMGSGTPHDNRARDMMPRFYIGELAQ